MINEQFCQLKLAILSINASGELEINTKILTSIKFNFLNHVQYINLSK